MRKTLYLVIALTVLCVAPIYAQGAFTDVPSEHWAYDAVESLQAKGILQGYPDGTYQGKRSMSRYELATVIARLLQQLPPPQGPVTGGTVDTSGFATKGDLNTAIDGVKGMIPANVATKDDVAALRKLVDGFKDELQSLGVDVDQAKRDLAALSARVDAIEAELKRVRFTGVFNVAAKVYSDNTPNTNYVTTGAMLTDKDMRMGNPINNSAGHVGSSSLRDMFVYRDFDLNIVGRVNENTTASATINFGNYINYLNSGVNSGAMDAFTPYYMAIATDLGFGQLTVGRFPLQLGNYTFKMPVADSYISLAKTDSGNRPVDGAMLKTGLLGLDWTWFAAQHDKVPSYAGYAPFTSFGPSNIYGVWFTQSAGVQIGANLPANIRLGATYYQGWDRNMYKTSAPDLVEVIGGDIAVPIPLVEGMALSGSWTQARPKVDGSRIKNIDDEAWEGRLNAPIGNLKIGVGYRDIGGQFSAPGAWDKIGNINNPVNVKGFNADLAYDFSDRFSVNLGGEMLELRENGGITFGATGLAKDDQVNKFVGGLAYKFSDTDKVGLDVEFDELDAAARPAKFDKPTTTYVTLAWGRQLGDNANLKVGYQFIDADAGTTGVADSSYKGSVGVVQLGVSF